MIKGIVIEQVPNKSLKIQTADGSVFVYDMGDVEKITKEQKSNKLGLDNSTYSYRNLGYKGFAEIGGGAVIGSLVELGTVNISTSHGYQFNPYFYLGGGISIQPFFEFGEPYTAFLPIFLNLRTNLIDNKISPFIDVKTGYVAVLNGFYMNTSLGITFPIADKCGMNFSIGYETYGQMQGAALESCSLRMGFEF